MNLAGYDLMVPGNHEFDFGTDAFLTNAGLAEFPVISSNIYRGGSLLLSGIQEGNSGCHTIIERNGVKRLFDIDLHTEGNIQIKCPKCRSIVKVKIA